MDLTLSRLIKMILGIFVFVAVVAGFYLFFKNRVIDFFKNVPTDIPIKMLLSVT